MKSDRRVHAPARTSRFPFWRVNPEGQELFEVRAGIPLDEALDDLSELIAIAEGLTSLGGTLESADCTDMAYASYAAHRLLSMCQALTCAIKQCPVGDELAGLVHERDSDEVR